MGDHDDDDDDDGKSKFEAERDKVLSELPQKLKDKFGTIGFCLVENDDDDDDNEAAGEKKDPPSVYYQPVLIVNPYDVPPKPVRDIYWMDAFTKAKRSKAKLAELDYLVYVYGSDDPDDCYNFVSQDEFITLEDAQAQGLDQLPEHLQEHIKAASSTTTTMTEVETKLVRGFQEMREDISKSPQDRKPQGKYSFVERHEEKKEPPMKKQKKN
jgi:hypothetical protein